MAQQGVLTERHQCCQSNSEPLLPYGFEAVVDPPLYTDVAVGSGIELDFQVLIMGEVAALPHDQSFPMTLEIYGDDSTLLGTKDVTVVVPGVPN